MTPIEVRELFDYDPSTGMLTRRYNRCGVVKGTVVHCNGEHFEASRVAWCHYHGQWPPNNLLVDHKDRDRKNNRISNLRLATYMQNGYNQKVYNPHGHKGITFDNTRGRWRAQIRINGTKVNLGRFGTFEEAVAVYEEAANRHHGEFQCP